MQTRNAVLAAHLLLQSVEATLPKQKKNAAVTEYKNAMVAHKRRTKARQEENAASENNLWRAQYTTFFGNSDNDAMIKGRQIGRLVEDEEGYTLFWREAFKRTYLGSSSKKLKSSRGYCRDCNTIVWLDNMKCSNEHTGLNSENQQIKLVLPSQVVGYLLDDSLSLASSSDSDSDSDGGPFSRLWAYQRPLSKTQ
ncbi:hypothetical protein GBA52_006027 [Prunus armeniaca]|nr:hypothetical protein GBA52_006027 [Prunus armeniaca]